MTPESPVPIHSEKRLWEALHTGWKRQERLRSRRRRRNETPDRHHARELGRS